MANRKKKTTTKNTRKKPKRTQEQNIALGVRILSKVMLLAAEEENEPLPEQQPFALLIEDLKHLKLSDFIKCYMGDLSPLIMAGKPNEQQLHEAWEAIKNKYFDASGNDSARASNDRQKLINTYIIFINRVRMLCDAIAVHYDERLVAELMEDGFDYPFTPETLDNDLRLVTNELIGWEVKRDALVQEEADEAAKNGTVAVNEEYFLEQLAELRKFEGYNTPVTRLAEEMTVYDYCLAMKRYNEDVIRKNNLNKSATEHGNG